ncbi:MAG TPA: methyltransferase domain-containing protein, partial [Patescibacteria group bacterium]|nr:methyltransferase domain-containing protein [Patescibacteria group bacterium]
HFIAYLLSIPLWLWIKIWPDRSPYFQQLSKFKFYHIHSIVFDQLIPRIANYWTQEEALALFSGQKDITNLNVYRVNNNSWTVIGQKALIESSSSSIKNIEKSTAVVSNFEAWNNRMAIKYNPDHYHHSRNPFIHFISYLRTRAIIKFLNIRPKDEVLDLGCGTGHMILHIKSGRVTGVDLSHYLLNIAREKLAGREATLIYGNVEDLPSVVKSKTYDKILSSEVIEHIKTPEKMIEQITLVAKPESLIVITFPYENLLNKIKSILHRFGLLQLLFKGIPTKMTDEWHLRFMDIKTFKKIIDGRLRILKIKKVPFSFLPIHYIVLCQKI